MDNIEKGTVVAIVVAFSAPFIAAPELASSDIYVVAGAVVACVGVAGKVVRDFFNRRSA